MTNMINKMLNRMDKPDSSTPPQNNPVAAPVATNAANPVSPPASGQDSVNWKDNVRSNTTDLSRNGLKYVGGAIALFSIFAVLPLVSSSVVTNGKVISKGQNKLLQHPTGGVVEAIAVTEGSLVNAGDMVLKIDPSGAIAQLAELTTRRDLLNARKRRLDAAKSIDENGVLSVDTPLEGAGLRGAIATEISATSTVQNPVFTEQEAELKAQTERIKSEISALQNQLRVQESEFDGVAQQLAFQRNRSKMLEEQRRKMAPLAEQGYVAKSRLWDVESQLIDLQSRIAELDGNADSLVSRMDETRDRITTLRAGQNEEVSRELTDVLSELDAIDDQIKAARNAVKLTDIRAPATGTLTKLEAHTVGGVIQAGTIIGEIVPKDSKLQVEARVTPQDIGSLSLEQYARVEVTAFNRRLEDPIDADVSYIAADSVIDEATGEPFFLIRLDLDVDEQIRSKLQAGMFADVFIQGQSRSLISYLLEPVTDSFRRAFNEK